MAKLKSVYFCSNCGNESPKWMGRCPACGEWGTFVEEIVGKNDFSKEDDMRSFSGIKSQPLPLNEINADEEPRINLCDAELNRVLGGGLVPASVVLIGGEPGIGKSTLVLQSLLKLQHIRSLYVSGEESARQIKLRADRIGIANDNCLIVCETNLDQIFTHIKNTLPQLVVIDSIQTVYSDVLESSPGSISQVRECAVSILKFAKQSGIPVILIGHITKEGNIAGPKILEHIVDTVLQFEGDRHYMYRILRSIKNRFGSTSEVGIYEMSSSGLREVTNPSELLLTQNHEGLSGVGIAAVIEGIRPFLIETQAVSYTHLDFFNIKKELVHSASRKREIVQARQVIMYFVKKHTKLSLAQIGAQIGNRNHSTVLHSCNAVKNLAEVDKRFRADIEEIERLLNS